MRITRLLVAAVLASAAVACSSSDNQTARPHPTPAPSQGLPSPTASAGGPVHDLRALTGNRWSDDALVLSVGDTVRVTDIDPEAPHNFVVAGVGRSPTLGEGDTFSLRFDKAGTYDFVCTFHQSQGMTGTITVR